jgi:hypothetical protein
MSRIFVPTAMVSMLVMSLTTSKSICTYYRLSS